jgi:uncharacterized protein
MDTPLALREFLEYTVAGLIDHPERISISHHLEGSQLTFEVFAHPDDVPFIVGKSGSTIKAIRNLMSASGKKHGLRIDLHVDPIDKIQAE